MSTLVVRVIVNAIALIVAATIVPNLNLEIGDTPEAWLKVGAVALVLGLINSFLRPIVKALALPISLMTMGLVGFVINAAMLLVLSWVSNALSLPFDVNGFPDAALNADTVVAAVLGAIIVGLVAAALGLASTGSRVLRFKL